MGNENYKLKVLMILALPLGLYVIFLVGGLWFLIVESLGYIPAFSMNKVSLSFYFELFSHKQLYRSLFFSLYIGTVSSAISTIVGVYLAKRLVFYENKVARKILQSLSGIFVILPYLYIVFLVLFMFSNTGLVGRILSIFGIPLSSGVLYSSYGIGIILTYVLKGIPFVMLYTIYLLKEIPKDYIDVSYLLGGTKEETIRKIYIPQCKNGITWSCLILFAYAIGSYEVYGLFANVSQQSISQWAYRLYTSPNLEDFPKAMALNMILLVVGGIYGFIYYKIVKKVIERRML